MQNTTARGLGIKRLYRSCSGQGKSLPLKLCRKLAYTPAFLQAKGTMGYKIHSVLDDSFVAEQASLDCYGGMLESFDYPGQLAGHAVESINHFIYGPKLLWLTIFCAPSVMAPKWCPRRQGAFL
ncbi:MAG: hypothetical protein R3D26_04425 [Cyanobacteriota/Melainabacteria group bacterium]